MSKVVRFSSRSQVYGEAASWIARLDRGVSDQEMTELRRWLSAQPHHKDAFIEMASLWDAMDVLSELADLFPLEQSPPERAAAEGTDSESEAPRRRWPWLVAASIVLGAAGMLVLGDLGTRWGTEATLAHAVIEEMLVTGVGEHTRWEMPDGSVITLNTDSEAKVAYAEDQRDVFLLGGEAHFDVVADPERDFQVYVANGVVQAVGTAFNVRLHDENRVEVAVAEGTVHVRHAAAEAQLLAQLRREEWQGIQNPTSEAGAAAVETRLAAGEVAVFNRSAAYNALQVFRRERPDMDIKLAWQRGMLVFQGEPLETVLAEMGRYTTAELVLADDSLRGVRVGGYFQSADLSGLLLALRQNFDIASERTDEGRVILRRAP